jgi:hypothetical protein
VLPGYVLTEVVVAALGHVVQVVCAVGEAGEV